MLFKLQILDGGPVSPAYVVSGLRIARADAKDTASFEPEPRTGHPIFLSCQIRKCAGRRCSSVDALSANDTVGHAEQELSG